MAGGGGNNADEFYLRYYVGHKGKFGHEFWPDGKLRYANNSNYKNDTMIRKEVFLTPSVLKECRRIISHSEVLFSLLFSFEIILIYICLSAFPFFLGLIQLCYSF